MKAYASETDVNSNLTLLFLHEEVDGVCNFSTNSVCLPHLKFKDNVTSNAYNN